MKRNNYIVLCLATLNASCYADEIKVHNESPIVLYVALYKKYKDGAERATDVKDIVPGQSVMLERPSSGLLKGYDRELAFSLEKEALGKNLSNDTYRTLLPLGVGDKVKLLGDFYLGFVDGAFKSFNAFDWNVLEPARKKLSLKDYIKRESIAIQKNPHKEKSADIRISNDLCQDEKIFLAHRLPRVKAALKSFIPSLKGDPSYVPKIALITSGGGYRAMLCTTGALVGAQKIGLLDCIIWISALSGSTWAVGGWVSSGASINEFKNSLVQKIEKPLQDMDVEELKLVVNSLLVKFAFDEPITAIDIYGTALANRLLSDFKDARYRTYLSDQAERVKDGALPLPIYTAVRADMDSSHEWYEYTPYEIGGAWLGMYVPTWAFGRSFYGGRSQNFAPEQTLGFQFGTFGSAFGATIDVITQKIIKKIESNTMGTDIKNFLKSTVEFLSATTLEVTSGKRFTWAEVNNFTAGIAASPIKDLRTVRIVDAGLDFNLPYPPVSGERLERKADILIFLDQSESLDGGKQLQKAEAYARSKNLKFPTIDYKNIDAQAISIFKDDSDNETPVVIYMPRIKEEKLWNDYKDKPEMAHLKPLLEGFDLQECAIKGFCKTANFTYTKKQSAQVTAMTEFNMLAVKDQLISVVQSVIEKKTPRV